MTWGLIAALTTMCGCILGIQIAFRPTMSQEIMSLGPIFDLLKGLCLGLVTIIIPTFVVLWTAEQGLPDIRLVLNKILPTCLVYSGIVFGFGVAAGPMFVKAKRFIRYIIGFVVLIASIILAALSARYI